MNRCTRSIVAAALLGCSGCYQSGGAGVAPALPDWASVVPGDVAVVIADPAGVTPLGSTVTALAPRLEELLGPTVEPVPGVFAIRAAGVRTGWATLADSTTFRTAFAALAERPAAAVVYLDLQLQVERAAGQIGDGVARRLLDAVDPRDLRYAIAALRAADGGGIDVDGWIASSGSSVGLGALLGAAPSAPALLAPDPEATLSIDAALDAKVGRRMIARLSPSGAPLSGGALGEQFGAAAERIAAEVAAHLDGRVALRIAADGDAVLAFGVVDPAAAAEALGRFAAPTSDGGLRLPGERIARFDGARLVITADDGRDTPAAGAAVPAASFALAGRSPDGRRFAFAVVRDGPGRLRVDGRIDG